MPEDRAKSMTCPRWTTWTPTHGVRSGQLGLVPSLDHDLRRRGLATRDVATILEISYQRVAQLDKDKKEEPQPDRQAWK